MNHALELGLNLRFIDKSHLSISLDETCTQIDIIQLLQVFNILISLEELNQLSITKNHFPDDLNRSTTFLTHPTFNRYHSEHEMLRYMRRLSDKDLALDRTMIPLGSCTMKLNAT